MTTTTTDPVARNVTPDDAIKSVVGYLKRSWEQLAADHVTGITTAELRKYAAALGLMSGRLEDAAGAIDAGSASVLVTDEVSGILRCTCGDIIPGDAYREHSKAHPDARYNLVKRF